MTRRFLALLCCAVALAACDKNGVQSITGVAPGASVMFFNFGVNAPGVNFYANTTKMTAISSTTGTESVKGTTYGQVGAGGHYSGIAPGQYTLEGKIADSVDKDLAISSVAEQLADGKYYSYYQSGFYDTTGKTVDAFVVEDPLPPVDYSTAYVRFVNAISNADAMTLYATNDSSGTVTAVGGTVAYKAAGDFTALPTGAYDLIAQSADTTAPAVRRAQVSFLAGRVYTISARGDITVVSSSATNRPYLDNTANR